MADKRYVIFGQYDSGLHSYCLPLIDSFDSEKEAFEVYYTYVEKSYDWLTLYDRIEGITLKED